MLFCSVLIITVSDVYICPVVNRAWKMEYVGSYHELLYNNIARLDQCIQYGNTVAIIQSSGTEKSCMVHECASLVFMIPFNLWEEIEKQSLFMFPTNECLLLILIWLDHYLPFLLLTAASLHISFVIAMTIQAKKSTTLSFLPPYRLERELSNMNKEKTYKELTLAW